MAGFFIGLVVLHIFVHLVLIFKDTFFKLKVILHKVRVYISNRGKMNTLKKNYLAPSEDQDKSQEDS